MNLANIKYAYFLGIGGIGMSAIARYFNHIGVQVWGYDKTETPLTQNLVAEGISIHYTEDLNLLQKDILLLLKKYSITIILIS
jgi:UDP-N-acetylmuramate--alanine ligase